MKVLIPINDIFFQPELVELSELCPLNFFIEKHRIRRTRPPRRSAVLSCVQLFLNILDEFVPLDGVVSIYVDFGEHFDCTVHQIDSFVGSVLAEFCDEDDEFFDLYLFFLFLPVFTDLSELFHLNPRQNLIRLYLPLLQRLQLTFLPLLPHFTLFYIIKVTCHVEQKTFFEEILTTDLP
jgi:hypothetical protein